MTLFRRFARCDAGTAAVEFAFIGLILILGTVATIEIGRALFMSNELAYAADRAARVVMLDFDIAESALTTSVRDADRLTALDPEAVQVASAAPGSTDTFRNVQLTYEFNPMIANLSIGSVTLTAARLVAR